MGDYFRNFFDTSDFPARWKCGNWSDFLGWLHIVSDLMTFAAYFAIPVALIYFARKRQDFPFTKLFFLFAGFILACGTVHLIEAIIFWYPIYRISGMMKLVTAVVSWATVVTLVRYMPRVMHFPSLATTNEQLQAEIQERKRIEKELLKAQRNLESQKRELELMYDAAPMGMSLVDAEMRYIRINQRLAEINGLTPEEHLGQRIRDVLPELGEQIEAFHQDIIATKQPRLDIEITGKTRASDSTHTWLASFYPLPDDARQSLFVSTIVQDITQRKRMEERLKRSEQEALSASQSKSEFLANMSHEIRTPMAAILGYADVLLGHLKDPDNRSCVLIMKRNGEHLLELINDILDLSRIEAGKLDVEPQEVLLSQLVAHLQSLLQVRADEKKIEFAVQYDGLVPRSIFTDPTRLRQVLINLIGNAIKFTDTGRVDLKVRFLENVQTPTIEFEIADTGIGISPEQQSRLFQPFSQADSSVARKYGGSGLGLAISHRLVKMLDGGLDMKSEPGRGSTFFVRLPVGAVSEILLIEPYLDLPSSEPERLVEQTQSLTGRILVVDDRRDVRHISQHFLEKAGAKVTTAENGRQGVDVCLAARDTGEPFDLIFMDMQMPEVDGLAATAELRSAGIDWPIIALTADAMKGDRDRCLNGGCDDYLSKPIDQAKLIHLAARYTQNITIKELRAARADRAAALRAALDADLSDASGLS
jgi:PAS domain S-box-containing protein